jgi:hypothetical protein
MSATFPAKLINAAHITTTPHSLATSLSWLVVMYFMFLKGESSS